MIAYLIVEHSDGPDWLLHEVHPTLEAATLRAEAWKTRDRSHGGRPYTWVRIIEQEGDEVFREWRFDDDRQEWVIDRGEAPEPDPTRHDGCREPGHVKRIEQLEAALAKVLRILTSDGAPIPETRNKAAVYAARKALARDLEGEHAHRSREARDECMRGNCNGDITRDGYSWMRVEKGEEARHDPAYPADKQLEAALKRLLEVDPDTKAGWQARVKARKLLEKGEEARHDPAYPADWRTRMDHELGKGGV